MDNELPTDVQAWEPVTEHESAWYLAHKWERLGGYTVFGYLAGLDHGLMRKNMQVYNVAGSKFTRLQRVILAYKNTLIHNIIMRDPAKVGRVISRANKCGLLWLFPFYPRPYQR